MPYLGTQPNDVKKNTGLYTPSEILQLEKDGHWGGSLELIEEQTVSGVGTIDFTSIQESTYNVHFFTFNDIGIALDGDRLKLRLFESGVVESASVYQYALQQCDTAGFSETKSTATDNLPIIKNSGTVSNEKSNGYTYIYNAGDSSKYTFNTYHSTTLTATPSYNSWFGGGVLPQASTVDGFRLFSGGNISGNIKLFGVKQI